MTGPERVDLAQALELQRAALELLKISRTDMGQIRDEMTDFRHELVAVVKDINTRVDRLEAANDVEIAKAAALGAVQARAAADKERRWTGTARLFAIVASAAGVGASLAVALHTIGVF